MQEKNKRNELPLCPMALLELNGLKVKYVRDTTSDAARTCSKPASLSPLPSFVAGAVADTKAA